jgi:hypothetical protein
MKTMKKRITITVVIMIISLIWGNVATVMATDISNAQYLGAIRELNSSYTATNVCVPFTLSTQNLINAGYINSDCSDTAITLANGNSIPYMPAVDSGTNWILFDDQISQNSAENFNLYIGGGSDMGGDIVYFPGASGMTVPDNATLEPGNNFEIEIDGFIDTSSGSNKYIVNKNSAFYLVVSNEGEITATIRQVLTTDSSIIRPSGNGSESAAGTYANVSDGSDGTYNQTTSTSYVRSLFACNDFAPEQQLISINSITVYYRYRTSQVNNSAYAKPAIKIGSTVYEGTETNVTTAYVTKSQVYNTSPATNQAWTQSEINSMELGYCYKATSGYGAHMGDVWIVVNYNYIVDLKTVSCSGINSGGHTLEVSADGTNLNLYIDDVLKDTEALAGVSIPNNANNWVFCQNNSALYLRSAKISVNGTLKGSWVWENNTTFTDLSGNGNTATPTFRVTSSDADVSASILALDPIALAEYEYSESDIPSLITTTLTAPSELYNESEVRLPGADLINELLDNSDIPRTLFWYPFLFGLAALFGLVTYYFSRDIMIQSIVNGGFLAFFGIMSGIPFWGVIPFALMATAIIISRKTVSL